MLALESKRLGSYFAPALGPAPPWCAFLENLTEEMEEEAPGSAAAYDDYRFVTRADLDRLGLAHLVGTKRVIYPAPAHPHMCGTCAEYRRVQGRYSEPP